MGAFVAAWFIGDASPLTSNSCHISTSYLFRISPITRLQYFNESDAHSA